MITRRVPALIAAATLAACARLPVGTDGRSLAERRDTLDSVASWELRGRLTIDTGDRAVQGRFNWQQDDDALELVVRNALGAGILRVTGRPDALTVTARGETRTLTDPETVAPAEGLVSPTDGVVVSPDEFETVTLRCELELLPAASRATAVTV